MPMEYPRVPVACQMVSAACLHCRWADRVYCHTSSMQSHSQYPSRFFVHLTPRTRRKNLTSV